MKRINDVLIGLIKDNTGENENPVDLLISITPMSKEAAYRRLRGDMDFTLEEAFEISKMFRTPLIHIFELFVESQRSVFHLYQLNKVASGNMEQYDLMIDDMLSSFLYVTESPHSANLYNATNYIPAGFLFRHKLLGKFNLFKWSFQMCKNGIYQKMSDIIIPQYVEVKKNRFAELMSNFTLFFIFTANLFPSIVKDIMFFSKVGLISKEEVEILKQELTSLVDTLEFYAETGKNEKGFPVTIYVSNAYLDASYLFMERSDGFQIASTCMYEVNFLGTTNNEICTEHKDWIDSMRAFSMCISKSGNIERVKFFQEQRASIESL